MAVVSCLNARRRVQMKNKVDKRTLRLAVGAALCAFVFVFCFARLVFKTDIRGAFNAADFDTS